MTSRVDAGDGPQLGPPGDKDTVPGRNAGWGEGFRLRVSGLARSEAPSSTLPGVGKASRGSQRRVQPGGRRQRFGAADAPVVQRASVSTFR